ncbi:hypothetical protein [Klebsiella pneumoniae]|uniref:hypothetical protein n=1 Tax=Klebsiella pneumoniae TaxID=573 RepID=UPI0003F6608B|nr:hypothetical protein [Klebsiella pneumoniae]MCB6159397.1 hypothetical protein [Klebsiella pneumoniae]MCB6190481.1 hypothetical protein [Klebsiella pneumoniae]MCD5748583.1 hypothetical protein [Klebsiella pneumoniae]MCL7862695.1 hypothetical protein [Klebsiella pneumoniae]MDQ5062016.1 hypothetical protein [Klebsiella pneumoniae]
MHAQTTKTKRFENLLNWCQGQVREMGFILEDAYLSEEEKISALEELLDNSTSYNTLQSVLQTYHDNYAIPMLKILNETQRDRTPESLMAAINAQNLAQAMLEHVGDVASRIASLEHSTLTQEEADVISEEISDALLLLLSCIEETCEMALELAPNNNH